MNMLVCTVDDKADNILSSFRLSGNDHKKYSLMKNKFNSYFVKHQTLYLSESEIKLKQEETANIFLFCLAEYWRIMRGKDQGQNSCRTVPSENMQLDLELPLDKVLSMAFQTETIHQ